MPRLRPLAVVLVAATAGAGCVIPAMPPPLSVARFARLPQPTGADVGGKVTATAGVVAMGSATVDQNGETGFDGEGALSLWLGRGYDLTLASSGYMTEAEGNLVLTHGPLRVGILHGVGLAVAVAGGGPTVFGEANAGLLAQVRIGGGVLLLAGRGSYDTVAISSQAYAATDATGPVPQPYASADVSVAWVGRIGGVEVAPELTLMRRIPVITSGSSPEWLGALMISVSAPFPGPAGR